MDQGGHKDSDNITNRLLQTDISFAQLTYDLQKIRLFTTNCFGMQLTVDAVIVSRLKVAQIDTQAGDLSSRQTYSGFFSGADIEMNLGPFIYRTNVYECAHAFDPLTQEITLFRTIQLVHKYYPKFKAMLDDIKKAKSFEHYAYELRDVLVDLEKKMKEAIDLIKAAQAKLVSPAFIDRFLDLLKKALSKFSEVAPLIDAKQLVIDDMAKQLFDFTNLTYAENVRIFKAVQKTFNDTRSTAIDLLQNERGYSSELLLRNITYLQSILTDKLEALYAAELRKAQPFFDLYNYWRN